MSRSKLMRFSLILLLGAALPIMLFLVKQSQDIRQHASESELITCRPLTEVPTATKSSTLTPDELKAELRQRSELLRQNAQALRDQMRARRDEIRQQAEARKTTLISLMQEDPKAALQYIKDNPISVDFQKLTTNCVEETGEVDGTFNISHTDNDDGTSSFYYTIDANSTPVNVYFADYSNKKLISRLKVRAKGYKLDNNILLESTDNNSLLAEGGTQSNEAVGSALTDATGSKNIAIIAVTFTDNRTTVDLSDIRNKLPTVNTYYQASSYNKTSLAGNVYGVYNLNLSSQNCNIRDITNAAMQAVNSQVNFMDLDYVMVAGRFMCGWGGLGTVGKWSTNSPDGTTSLGLSLVQVGQLGVNIGTMEHELGHNFGVQHAAFLNCGSVTVGTNCTRKEYGDPYDVMGISRNQGQMNAYHKEYIGWLTPTTIATITTSGQYRIGNYQTTAENLKALRINRTNQGPLYIENRPNGVMLHQYYSWSGHTDTDLLDTTPPADALSPTIPVGSTYTDTSTNIKIKVLEKTSSSALINVTIPVSTTVVNTPTPTQKPASTPTPTPTTAVSSTTLTGKVFLDTNANSIFDATEKGYASGVRVTVYKQSSTGKYDLRCCSQLTNSLGIYTFTNRTSGKYQISIELPSGYKATTNSVQFGSIPSNNATINFGIVPTTTTATILLGDLNHDGKKDDADYTILLECYRGVSSGCTAAQHTEADSNKDGILDGVDYNLFLRN